MHALLPVVLIPTDAPPLEDLSDAVRRARALQTQVPGNPLSRTSDDESRMRSRNGGAAKKGIAVDQSKSERLGKSPTKLGEAEERRGASSRVFGGFAKGFLLSESSNSGEDIGKSKPAPKSQSSTEKQVKKKSVSSLADADSKGLSVKTGSAQSSVSTDDNVPFLRMNKTESKGPVFPEVQEAMKEAYPLLNTQGHTHTHTPCMYSHLLMSFNSHSSPSPISLSSLSLLSPSPISLSSLPLPLSRVADRVTAREDGEAPSPLQSSARSTAGSGDVPVPVQPESCAPSSCRQPRCARVLEGVLCSDGRSFLRFSRQGGRETIAER